MLCSLPNEIQEQIFEFSNYKIEIQNYFKENIAPKIDTSLKKIDNSCELCYIEHMKGNLNGECLIHSILQKKYNNSKYFSLYNFLDSPHSKPPPALRDEPLAYIISNFFHFIIFFLLNNYSIILRNLNDQNTPDVCHWSPQKFRHVLLNYFETSIHDKS